MSGDYFSRLFRRRRTTGRADAAPNSSGSVRQPPPQVVLAEGEGAAYGVLPTRVEVQAEEASACGVIFLPLEDR